MSERTKQGFAVFGVVIFSLFHPAGRKILILKRRFAVDVVATLPVVVIYVKF